MYNLYHYDLTKIVLADMFKVVLFGQLLSKLKQYFHQQSDDIKFCLMLSVLLLSHYPIDELQCFYFPTANYTYIHR